MGKNVSERTVYRERAFLVGLLRSGRDDPLTDALDEVRQLAETAGAHVVGGTVQKLRRPYAATYFGSGKIEEIGRRAEGLDAQTVVFDVDLTPAQTRNLEKILRRRVIDRTSLILDIFATHARTSQAKLQVELAQLEYAMPRLRRMWTHLGQQVGGMSASGKPGIGQRGPGEKQLEVDRRLARDRIAQLRRELKEIEERKEREVAARVSQRFAVSLVGYTNAGKSTLLNALTDADALVEDRLFSTLDTRTRLWKLSSGIPVLLSDTVGFLRDLPHGLVASFHATLEEVSQADLLLHVVDASHPQMAEQVDAVRGVLQEIGCGGKEILLVLNKVDRLRDAVELQILRNRHPNSVGVSAMGRVGLDLLDARVGDFLSSHLVEAEIAVPSSEGRTLAELHEQCTILSKSFEGERVRMRVRAPRRFEFRLAPYRVNGRA